VHRLVLLLFLLFLGYQSKAQVDECDEYNPNFLLEDYKVYSFEDYVCNDSIVYKFSSLNSATVFNNSYFFWWFLLFLWALVVLLWNLERTHSIQLLKSLVSVNLMLQISRTVRGKERFFGFLLTLAYNFLVSIAFFKFLLLNFSKEINWYYLILIFLFLNFLDAMIISIGAYIKKMDYLATSHRFNNDSIVLLGFTLMLPILFVMLYASLYFQILFSWLFIVLFIVLIAIKEVRSLQLLNSYRIKIFNFYFFIYLCTFKIIPILVLVKFFFSQILV